VARDAAYDILKLENKYTELWITPRLTGAVIRWRVKDLAIELLRGYKHYGRLPAIWREYTHTPPIGQPIADAFKVDACTRESATLRTATSEGLTVIKRLALSPDSNQVEFALTFRNDATEPVVPLLKSVPEFYTQGAVHPEIWAELNGQWTRMNPEPEPSRLEMLPKADYTRLAVRLPAAGATLVCTFTPGEARPLLFAYRTEDPYNQLNLDVLPNQAPLEPGETRTAAVRYFLTKKPPTKLSR